ncbi:hypothetical protein AAVH_31206, partial [Aphelenchoides avenae]
VYVFYRGLQFGFFIETFRHFDFGAKFLYTGTGYCAYFQVSGHMVIAINRFTVFYFETKHEKLWSGRFLTLVLL